MGGTQAVADINISTSQPQDTVNLMSLLDQKSNNHLPIHMQRYSSSATAATGPVSSSSRLQDVDTSLGSLSNNDYDPVLGRSPLRSKFRLSSKDGDGGTLGGFPVVLLKKIARLSRILAVKKEKIDKLAAMNSDAEKANSYGESLNLEFQRKYATIVLDLERLNKDLNDLLIGVQRFCVELYPEQTLPNDQTTLLRRQCLAKSEEMVVAKNVGNLIGTKSAVRNTNLTDLVSHLTSLMIQVKVLTDCQGTSIEFKSLGDAMKEIKSKLSPENAICFQNNVEIHIAHIKSGMEHDAYAQNNNNNNNGTENT